MAMISVSYLIWIVWHIGWLGLENREFLGYWYTFIAFIVVLLAPLWVALDRWIWRPLALK